MTRSGGQVLVDQLVLHGADVAFGVPGESYLAVLDALHDAPLRLVVTRHESGAANMRRGPGRGDYRGRMAGNRTRPAGPDRRGRATVA